MTADKMKHVQQTFLGLGDEFLVQYFLCSHQGFRDSQILSRLFAMGHSLELYAKAVLVSPEGIPPMGHDVPSLLARCTPALALTPEEIVAGESLFASDVVNVDLGVWLAHEEAMELYQAQYFLKDLKYLLTQEGDVIFPARKSLMPVNGRYLELARELRASMQHRDTVHDRALVNLVGLLGFEENPALRVIGAEESGQAQEDV